jgi:ATP-binding cassette subfamily B protein
MSDPPRVLASGRLLLFGRLVAIGLLQAAAMVAVLFLVRYVFDSLSGRHGPIHLGRILWVGPALAVVAAGRGWLAYQSRFNAARLGRNYTYEMIMHMYDYLTSLSPRSLQRRSHGAVMLRFSGDLSTIRRWISRGMAAGTVSGITIGIALAVLAWFSPTLALTVIVFLALEVLASRGPIKFIRRAVAQLRRVSGRLMAAIGEQIQAMASIQVFGEQGRERARFSRRSERVLRAAIVQARAAGQLQALTAAAAVAARAGILVAGAVEVSRGRTTLGTVAAALTVAGLLSSRVRSSGRIYVYYQRARVARRKILQFLATPTHLRHVPGAPDLKPGPGALEFERVTLSPGIREVNVRAETGMRVALVGPNGAGKSTLLALASRLIDPDEGRVMLDGQDLALHSLSSVRRRISMDSPDLPLLRGSVAHNLLYRRPDAPKEELGRVQSLCGVDKLLAELPEGERTRILEGGKNLSLGQRQRISLARALLGNPSVLLLDEADANLDEEAGRVLDVVLEEFRGTVIMVSHRPERIAKADVIWRLEEGRLVGVEQRRVI